MHGLLLFNLSSCLIIHYILFRPYMPFWNSTSLLFPTFTPQTEDLIKSLKRNRQWTHIFTSNTTNGLKNWLVILYVTWKQQEATVPFIHQIAER